MPTKSCWRSVAKLVVTLRGIPTCTPGPSATSTLGPGQLRCDLPPLLPGPVRGRRPRGDSSCMTTRGRSTNVARYMQIRNRRRLSGFQSVGSAGIGRSVCAGASQALGCSQVGVPKPLGSFGSSTSRHTTPCTHTSYKAVAVSRDALGALLIQFASAAAWRTQQLLSVSRCLGVRVS